MVLEAVDERQDGVGSDGREKGSAWRGWRRAYVRDIDRHGPISGIGRSEDESEEATHSTWRTSRTRMDRRQPGEPLGHPTLFGRADQKIRRATRQISLRPCRREIFPGLVTAKNRSGLQRFMPQRRTVARSNVRRMADVDLVDIRTRRRHRHGEERGGEARDYTAAAQTRRFTHKVSALGAPGISIARRRRSRQLWSMKRIGRQPGQRQQKSLADATPLKISVLPTREA